MKNNNFNDLTFVIAGTSTRNINNFGKGKIPCSGMIENWQGATIHSGDKVELTMNYSRSNSNALGTDKFLKDFDLYFAKLYDGIRHDSGDPIVWGYKVIEHYKKLRISPKTKTLLFSDSLNFEKAYKIYKEFKDETNVTFGIGTFIMNDFEPVAKPLNIVMKLQSVNGKPVAKLSDDEGKTICEDEEFLHYLRIVANE